MEDGIAEESAVKTRAMYPENDAAKATTRTWLTAPKAGGGDGGGE
jgi:hypothetical protein